jgi:uncharacterized protein involved in tellurium resistance
VLSAVGFKNPPKDPTTKKRTDKQDVKYGKIYDAVLSVLNKYKGSKKHLFVEIYTTSHTAQIELQSGKLYSICESEKAGIRKIGNKDEAEKILTSTFFDDADTDATMTLCFDVHAAHSA